MEIDVDAVFLAIKEDYRKQPELTLLTSQLMRDFADAEGRYVQAIVDEFEKSGVSAEELEITIDQDVRQKSFEVSVRGFNVTVKTDFSEYITVRPKSC